MSVVLSGRNFQVRKLDFKTSPTDYRQLFTILDYVDKGKTNQIIKIQIFPLCCNKAMDVDFVKKDFNNKTCNKQSYSFMDCKVQLMMDFPYIYSFHIDKILKFHKGQYIKAYNSLTLIMSEINKMNSSKNKDSKQCFFHEVIINNSGESTTLKIQPMSTARPRINKPVPLLLKKEMESVKEQIKIHEGLLFEEADRKFALSLLEEDYQEMGQLIECVCCFGKCAFDNMAQCMEGHLVCIECLNAFTRESAYGAGKIALGCMAPDCLAIYPEGELKRCLSASTLAKLEERVLKENLNMANIKNLAKCPHCDFAAILSPSVKVFHCYKDNCQKETCRDCGTDWTEHEGLPCERVEKKDETALRKQMEEKMTSVKVRTCSRCKAEFTKETGCNKITCRCGMTMCYICRTPGITIDHFCDHLRSPGKPCKLCTACSIWSSSEMDEERAMKEITEEAQRKRKALRYEDDKQIGVPTTSKASKTKKKR